jgi:hypothetical protein
MPFMSIRYPAGEVVIESSSTEFWGKVEQCIGECVWSGMCAPITDYRAQWLAQRQAEEFSFNHVSGKVKVHAIRAAGRAPGGKPNSRESETLVMGCIEKVLIEEMKRRPGRPPRE